MIFKLLLCTLPIHIVFTTVDITKEKSERLYKIKV